MAEIPLLIFTLCLNAAVGIMLFVAIAKLKNKDGSFKTAIVSAAVLAVVGLLASLLHLGRPLAALNSLLGVGHSWLSREIWFTGAVTAVIVVSALLSLFRPAARRLLGMLIYLAVILGLADIFVMASIYHFSSVPAWQNGLIYAEFYGAALSLGAVLFLVTSRKEGADSSKIVIFTAACAIVLQVTAMVSYLIALGASDSLAAQQSFSLLGEMSPAVIIKLVFILGGAMMLFYPVMNQISVHRFNSPGMAAAASATDPRASSIGLYTAAALITIGQIAGRLIFYEVMVIATIGLS